jgi:hypothetical protein
MVAVMIPEKDECRRDRSHAGTNSSNQGTLITLI